MFWLLSYLQIILYGIHVQLSHWIKHAASDQIDDTQTQMW